MQSHTHIRPKPPASAGADSGDRLGAGSLLRREWQRAKRMAWAQARHAHSPNAPAPAGATNGDR